MFFHDPRDVGLVGVEHACDLLLAQVFDPVEDLDDGRFEADVVRGVAIELRQNERDVGASHAVRDRVFHGG